MDDNSFGVYLLQQWAEASGADPQALVQYYLGKYGQDAVTGLGTAGQSIQVGSFQDEVKKLISQGSSPNQPTQADLNQALLDLGAQPVSVTAAIVAGVSDSVSEAESAAKTVATFSLSALKYVAVIAVVVAGAYLAFEAGLFKHVAKGA